MIKMKSIKYFFIAICLFLGCSQEYKTEFTFKPKEQTKGFYTSDIDLFWKAYDYISPNFTKKNFKKIYIKNGSVGLNDYANQKNLASELEKIFRSNTYCEYYSSIRTNTQDLHQVIKKSKKAFERFQELYSEINIFDVYFIIGALGAGGRVSENGLFIAVEMFSKTENSPIDSLGEWHQNVIKSKDCLPSIVVHELVHQQQRLIPRGRNKTLLEQSILEGMADFISFYILPDEPFMNDHIHIYADSLERELWDDFKQQKDEKYNNTEWLYTGKNTSKGYPADLGYYIGFKILASYCDTFESKDEAISMMLSFTDYYELFEKSGYAIKFLQ